MKRRNNICIFLVCLLMISGGFNKLANYDMVVYAEEAEEYEEYEYDDIILGAKFLYEANKNTGETSLTPHIKNSLSETSKKQLYVSNPSIVINLSGNKNNIQGFEYNSDYNKTYFYLSKASASDTSCKVMKVTKNNPVPTVWMTLKNVNHSNDFAVRKTNKGVYCCIICTGDNSKSSEKGGIMVAISSSNTVTYTIYNKKNKRIKCSGGLSVIKNDNKNKTWEVAIKRGDKIYFVDVPMDGTKSKKLIVSKELQTHDYNGKTFKAHELIKHKYGDKTINVGLGMQGMDYYKDVKDCPEGAFYVTYCEQNIVNEDGVYKTINGKYVNYVLKFDAKTGNLKKVYKINVPAKYLNNDSKCEIQGCSVVGGKINILIYGAKGNMDICSISDSL